MNQFVNLWRVPHNGAVVSLCNTAGLVLITAAPAFELRPPHMSLVHTCLTATRAALKSTRALSAVIATHLIRRYKYSTSSLTELSQVLGVITARRALLSLLELDLKCSELVTTSTQDEFSSVGSGAVCSIMTLKNKTLHLKPITKRPKYD